MSIWCSGQRVGHDDTLLREESRGDVRSYASGWSNHYPDPVNGPERPGSVDVSYIPSWCVPGNSSAEADDRFAHVGPWLRLWMSTWDHEWNSGGEKVVGRVEAAVVMDEDAARALRDDLTAWLDEPKVHPIIEGKGGSDGS